MDSLRQELGDLFFWWSILVILDGGSRFLPSIFTFFAILDGKNLILSSNFAFFTEMDDRDAVFAGSPWRSGEGL